MDFRKGLHGELIGIVATEADTNLVTEVLDIEGGQLPFDLTHDQTIALSTLAFETTQGKPPLEVDPGVVAQLTEIDAQLDEFFGPID